jgi:hypothetical protein
MGTDKGGTTRYDRMRMRDRSADARNFPALFSNYSSTKCSTSTMATGGDIRSRDSIQTL